MGVVGAWRSGQHGTARTTRQAGIQWQAAPMPTNQPTNQPARPPTQRTRQRLVGAEVCADGGGDEGVGAVDEEAGGHHQRDIGGHGEGAVGAVQPQERDGARHKGEGNERRGAARVCREGRGRGVPVAVTVGAGGSHTVHGAGSVCVCVCEGSALCALRAGAHSPDSQPAMVPPSTPPTSNRMDRLPASCPGGGGAGGRGRGGGSI